MAGTWWYWVRKGRHWLLLGGTGLVYCGTGWYLVVLSQNRAVLVSSVICFQKIYGLHGLKHQIIEFSKKERMDRQTNKQTSKQTEFPLVDSTPYEEGVE